MRAVREVFAAKASTQAHTPTIAPNKITKSRRCIRYRLPRDDGERPRHHRAADLPDEIVLPHLVLKHSLAQTRCLGEHDLFRQEPAKPQPTSRRSVYLTSEVGQTAKFCSAQISSGLPPSSDIGSEHQCPTRAPSSGSVGWRLPLRQRCPGWWRHRPVADLTLAQEPLAVGPLVEAARL